MPVVNPVNPLGNFIPPWAPLDNLTPFTLRDGMSYLEVLNRLRYYINMTLVPYVNTTFEMLGTSFSIEVNRLIEDFNEALVDQTKDVDKKLEDLTTYVNNAIEQIINNSIQVQDPVVANLVENANSATRKALDALYATKGQLAIIATTVGSLNDRIDSLEDRVDVLEDAMGWYSWLHDIHGDGTDELAKINAFIAGATAAGFEAYFERGKTFSVSDAVKPVTGAIINLNGSTIKQMGTGASGTIVLDIASVSDVQVFDGIIDGNRAAYSGATEWRHGLAVRNSDNITIRDVLVKNCKGDGIYIGEQATGPSVDVLVENVICDNNYRNGMSISHGMNITVRDSIFSNSNGTAPQAGVDVEPNNETVACANIVFDSCVFYGNYYFGCLVAFPAATPTAPQGNVQFVNCSVYNNGVGNGTGVTIPPATGGGVRIVRINGFDFQGGIVRDNRGPGILLDSTGGSQNVNITGTTVTNNTNQGILATQQYTNLSIALCHVYGNGISSAGQFAAIELSPSAVSNGANLIGNIGGRAGNSSQGYGLKTNTNAQRVVCIGNDFAYNANPYSIAAGTPGSALYLDVGNTGSLRFVGRVQFDSGLAIASSSSDIIASAPAGTLTKKYRVWDETNTVIGYIPLYPA